MESLIAKLKSATEGSRELDAEIAVALEYGLPAPMGDARAHLRLTNKYDEEAPGTYWVVQFSGRSLRSAPNFTTSVDAAIRLKAPWMRVNADWDEDGKVWVYARHAHSTHTGGSAMSYASRPTALNLCEVIVRVHHWAQQDIGHRVVTAEDLGVAA